MKSKNTEYCASILQITLTLHQLFQRICDESPENPSEKHWIRLLAIQPQSYGQPLHFVPLCGDIVQESAGAMGLEAFDEQAFTEQIDHITVTSARELTFHFKDGHLAVRQWVNTSKKDCWTAEYRAEASAYRRSHQALGKKGSSCFTSKIKCGECGNNFQHQTRSYRDGKVGVWTCATKRNRADDCSMPTVREDVLKALCCEALEMEVFDPAIFSARVDHITLIVQRGKEMKGR